jgi:protocatechuate 4,5-dioxygenase alpha chain
MGRGVIVISIRVTSLSSWCQMVDRPQIIHGEHSDWGIPGTYVFDHTRARTGYELNKLAYSLTQPQNREVFRRDEGAYIEMYALTDGQRAAIGRRDWLALTKEYGGNIYYIYKLGATLGFGLYQMGAQMRGESYEDFLNSRHAKGAR